MCRRSRAGWRDKETKGGWMTRWGRHPVTPSSWIATPSVYVFDGSISSEPDPLSTYYPRLASLLGKRAKLCKEHDRKQVCTSGSSLFISVTLPRH